VKEIVTKKEEKFEIFTNNFVSNDDFSKGMKQELEIELEKHNYEKLYKIIDENTKTNMVSFDLDLLNRSIFEEFSGRNDNNRIENFINKVPDLFAIILKDREYLIESKQ